MRRIFAVALLVVLGLAPAALAAPKGDSGPPTHGCDQALENNGDPYDSTCDGSPSANGQGEGAANGKPCAGCVGAADNKNPKGQMPNGTDANNGYECDGNKGVGVGNPAHTACDAYAGMASGKSSKLKGASKARAVDFEVESGGITGKVAMILALLLASGVLTTAIVATRTRNVSEQHN